MILATYLSIVICGAIFRGDLVHIVASLQFIDDIPSVRHSHLIGALIVQVRGKCLLFVSLLL